MHALLRNVRTGLPIVKFLLVRQWFFQQSLVELAMNNVIILRTTEWILLAVDDGEWIVLPT